MSERTGEQNLEQRAFAARNRLIGTLDALERRREHVVAMAREVTRAATRVALAIATGAMTTFAFLVFRRRSRRARVTGPGAVRSRSLVPMLIETAALVGLSLGFKKFAAAPAVARTGNGSRRESAPEFVRENLPH
jgi:hypothetical protein